MPSRNTRKLKELIFTTLNSDATLQTLLGGPGKIKHANPLSLAEYPCVVYDLVADSDEPYLPDQPTGISNTRLAIQIFSNSTSSGESDTIEDRVYELLHGKNLINSDHIIYSCYRVNRFAFFESEFDVWRVETRYDVVNALK